MDSYEKSYNLSLEGSFVSMKTDIRNLFDCYMDLMRAFAMNANESQIFETSSDFVIWYETYRTKYGQPFIDQMQEALISKLTQALEMAIGWARSQMPENSKKGQTQIAVVSGNLQILRAFEASGMDFEELSGPMDLWAELRRMHGK